VLCVWGKYAILSLSSPPPPPPPPGPPFAARLPLDPSSTREDDTDTRARARIKTKYAFEEAHVVGCVRAYVCFRARCNCRLTDHAFLSAGAGVLRARIFCRIRSSHGAWTSQERWSGRALDCIKPCTVSQVNFVFVFVFVFVLASKSTRESRSIQILMVRLLQE
jgi:hypothetical protein